MATLAVQQVTTAGVTPTENAANGGGDDFPNDGKRTFLYVKNGDVSPTTLTFDDTLTNTPTGAKSFNPDVDLVVNNGADAVIGPFPVNRFGTSVGISYSSVTSLTVAVLQLP